MILRLTNELSGQEYEFDVEDTGNFRYYWDFYVELPDGVQDGQYLLELIDDDDEVIAREIAQVGDYVNNVEKYTDDDDRERRIVYQG